MYILGANHWLPQIYALGHSIYILGARHARSTSLAAQIYALGQSNLHTWCESLAAPNLCTPSLNLHIGCPNLCTWPLKLHMWCANAGPINIIGCSNLRPRPLNRESVAAPNLCTPSLNLHTWCASLGAQSYALGHSIYILGANHWLPQIYALGHSIQIYALGHSMYTHGGMMGNELRIAPWTQRHFN